jgi:hypothetical protein
MVSPPQPTEKLKKWRSPPSQVDLNGITLIYNFFLTALEEVTGMWKISFSTYECSRVY